MGEIGIRVERRNSENTTKILDVLVCLGKLRPRQQYLVDWSLVGVDQQGRDDVEVSNTSIRRVSRILIYSSIK